MLKSRRYNASQALLSTNSVNRWFKHLDGPITKTLPNGIEKEIKGSLQKNTRTRQEKRTRGQMSNNCHFRSNKAVDYGDASEKYNYSKNQQSSEGNQDFDPELSEGNQDSDHELSEGNQDPDHELPDSEGSDEEDDEDEDESKFYFSKIVFVETNSEIFMTKFIFMSWLTFANYTKVIFRHDDFNKVETRRLFIIINIKVAHQVRT